MGNREIEKGLNRDEIKYIAALTMLLNHVATIFLPDGNILTEVLIHIGYFTAVTMCYFLVEGFAYTRAKKRYAMRLAAFAVISEIPYCLAFTEEGILAFCGMNMLFTLLLCFFILFSLEKISNWVLKGIVVAGLVLLSTISDWALLAPAFTLLFYWAKGETEKTKTAFGISALLFGLVNFTGGIGRFSIGTNLLYTLASMASIVLAGIVIVYLYNGKRAEKGKAFSKWFFYLFYPLHLLILGIVRIG